MSQQDRSNEIIVNHEVMKQVVDEVLPAKLFRGIASRSSATWKPRMVVACVLFLLTSGEKTLGKGFELARKVVAKVFRWHLPPGASYQGFVEQLLKWQGELKVAVIMHLHDCMREQLSDQWTIGGFVVFAGDGSRVELSRTLSLETAYSPQKKRAASAKKKGAKSSSQKKQKSPRKKKTQSAESIKKKNELAADVVDFDVACRQRLALGLADGPVGFQRTRTPGRDAAQLAGKRFNYSGCGLRGL